MFIAIILGIFFVFGLIMFFGGVLKKVVEVISVIAKFCVSAALSTVICMSFLFWINHPWILFAFILVGAVVLFMLIMKLSATNRLIGFSVNYLINSFIVLIVALLLPDDAKLDFVSYAVALFLFPRIMWISDRFATTTEFSHSEYSFLGGVTTDVYNVHAKDWWVDYGDAWKNIPVQITIASVFYLAGSATLMVSCPIESGWLVALYLLIATVLNVIFDFFVFRKIDEKIHPEKKGAVEILSSDEEPVIGTIEWDVYDDDY